MTDNLIITITVPIPDNLIERSRVIVQTHDGLVARLGEEVARFDGTMDSRIVPVQAEQPPRAKRGRKPKVAASELVGGGGGAIWKDGSSPLWG